MLTLVGCKMLVGVDDKTLLDAAYGVLLKSRSNVVIANDLRNLQRKLFVHQDQTMVEIDGDWDRFNEFLLQHILDEHYRTEQVVSSEVPYTMDELATARLRFDNIVSRHRQEFFQWKEMAFGSVAVRIGDSDMFLVSPREKGQYFKSPDAVIVCSIDNEKRIVEIAPSTNKATLNAPLLINHLQAIRDRRLGPLSPGNHIIHAHRQLPGLTTVPHAPPGTVRDSVRPSLPEDFNIEGHGFVIVDRHLH